jgi:hypothetical protein
MLLKPQLARRIIYLIIWTASVALGLLSVAAAQQRAAVQAPPDVKPASVSLEDIPYPHPVRFLPMTLYGHDVRMA